MAWNEKTSPTFDDYLANKSWPDTEPCLDAIADFNCNFDTDPGLNSTTSNTPSPTPSSYFGSEFDDNEIMDSVSSVESHELVDASAGFGNVGDSLLDPFDESDMSLASSFLLAGHEEGGHRRSISEPPESFASLNHAQNNGHVYRKPFSQVRQRMQPTFVRRGHSIDQRQLDTRPIRTVPKNKTGRSRPYPPAVKDQFTRNRLHPMSHHLSQPKQPPTSTPRENLHSHSLPAQATASYASLRVCTPELEAPPDLSNQIDPRLRGQAANSSRPKENCDMIEISKDELRFLIVDAVEKAIRELTCPVRVVERGSDPATAGSVESVEKQSW